MKSSYYTDLKKLEKLE